MIREIKKTVLSGYPVIVVLTAVQLGLGYMFVQAVQAQAVAMIITAAIASIMVLICWCIFWPIPITDSVLNRSSILEHTDH